MGEKLKRHLPLILLAAGILLLSIACIPLVRWLMVKENQDLIWTTIDRMGIWGVVLFMGIQLLQIIIAIIPGEPVELAAGMLYGTLGGLMICLVGVLIGSSIIFAIVRRLGKPFVSRFIDEGSMKKYAFLQDAQKLDTLIFIMFLIPGTPKDALTYICPLTSISLPRFLLLSTFARLPSVISSTFAGANFASGNLWGTALILLCTSIIGLLGIKYEETLTQKLNRSASRLKDKLAGKEPTNRKAE